MSIFASYKTRPKIIDAIVSHELPERAAMLQAMDVLRSGQFRRLDALSAAMQIRDLRDYCGFDLQERLCPSAEGSVDAFFRRA